MSNRIQLQISSISKVPFDQYPKDFTFIVNGKTYETNKILADILSPKISRIHLIDPTISEYSIHTKSSGEFTRILNLVKEDEINLDDQETQFISEVIEELGTKAKFSNDKKDEIKLENVLDLIEQHNHFPNFYKETLQNEIEFASENFYHLKDEQEDKLYKLSFEILDKIMSNSKLRLVNEDQLIDVVNHLVSKNQEYSNLYDYVFFSNVEEVSKIEEYLKVFDINRITHITWQNLSSRLKHKIFNPKENETNEMKETTRYVTSNKTAKHVHEVGTEIPFKNEEFNGILKWIQTNSNINNEVELSASGSLGGGALSYLLQFDNKSGYFFPSFDDSNSWICYEFKNHQIIISHYTIRSEKSNKINGDHMKSWIIEGSNDKNSWKQIDEQKNCNYLNGSNYVHTFAIKNTSSNDSFRYIRLRMTGPNWHNRYLLLLSALEFYGRII